MVAVKRAAFQSIASMCVPSPLVLGPGCADPSLYRARALPAFTIHTAVKQAKKLFVNATNPRVKTWGPTATGLAIVPVLPYLFDKPVEHATDTVFEWIEHKIIESQTASSSSKSTEL